jgi:hypothetical protein
VDHLIEGTQRLGLGARTMIAIVAWFEDGSDQDEATKTLETARPGLFLNSRSGES